MSVKFDDGDDDEVDVEGRLSAIFLQVYLIFSVKTTPCYDDASITRPEINVQTQEKPSLSLFYLSIL